MAGSASLVRFVLAIAVCAGSASADVIWHDGSFAFLDSPPASLARGALESNEHMVFFAEATGLELDRHLKVNVSSAGLFDSRGSMTPMRIDAGTSINSYLLHADGDESLGSPTLFSGTLTFAEPILGVIIRGKKLQNSDLFFSDDGIDYGHARDRSLNFGRDSVWISDDMRTITIELHLLGGRDQIRIITQGTPVPAPGALAILALAVASVRRRARRSHT